MKKSNQFLIKLESTEYNTPDISKIGAFAAAKHLYDNIISKKYTAVQVAEMLKFVEETSKQLREIEDDNGKNGFVELVRKEIKDSKYSEGLITKNGTKFELFEAAIRNDYSVCGDPVWSRISKEIDLLKEMLKEREAFLKTIKEEQFFENLQDPFNKEVYSNVKIHPPISSSTPTYKQTMLDR